MSWHSITSKPDSSKGKVVPETSNDDLKTCKNPNEIVGGSFDLTLTKTWLGDLQVKTEYVQSVVLKIQNPMYLICLKSLQR